MNRRVADEDEFQALLNRAPLVVLYFSTPDQSMRWVRTFHLAELRDHLTRPYSPLFGEEA